MEWCLTLKQVSMACSGAIFNCDEGEIVKNVVTDSRKTCNGAIFIALKGEKFDGHRFVKQALNDGAICCIVDENYDADGLPLIKVGDTYKALRDIAAYYRMQFNIPAVAVTGSVGKTSTKDMIHSVLSQEYKALKTQGNFNNEIGLPLTVFELTSEDQIMVLEMGMSNFGEISRLSKIARPETAVITNIGYSHIEHLGSRESIMKAKLEVLDGLSNDGTLILNGDDELLWSLEGTLPCETLYYGINNTNCDLIAADIKQYSDSTTFCVKIDGEVFDVEICVPGEHHIYNALAAILAGIQYNIHMGKIIKGIKDFMPSGLRQNIVPLEKYILIKDCYNASPGSMKAGLDVLSKTLTNKADKNYRRVAILGDMLELGDYAVEAHKEVGSLITNYKVDCLITVGHMAEYIAMSAVEHGFDASDTYVFYDNQSLKENILGIIKECDIILLKASRGMRLEEIADFLSEGNN